jgi:hypothetical protein
MIIERSFGYPPIRRITQDDNQRSSIDFIQTPTRGGLAKAWAMCQLAGNWGGMVVESR